MLYRGSFTNRRAALIGVGLALLGASASATPASAASSLSALRVTNGDLVVDKTATFALTGFAEPADGSQEVSVDVNPQGLPCSATEDVNRERRIDRSDSLSIGSGAFPSAVVSWKPTSPGAYTLCGWLSDLYSSTSRAAISVPVVVRPPATSLTASLPGRRLNANATVPLLITASSEVTRAYVVELNRVGVPCGPNAEANAAERTWVWESAITGGPTTVAENVDTPSEGHFHTCGYVGTGRSDPAPTTVFDGADFWAGRPVCKLGAAPRRPSGTVKLTCTNTDGPITLTSRRGKKRFSTTVALTQGVARVGGRAIGLKRRAAVTVIASADGVRGGRRTLRVHSSAPPPRGSSRQSQPSP